jgi:hypothetical protein
MTYENEPPARTVPTFLPNVRSNTYNALNAQTRASVPQPWEVNRAFDA